MDKLLVICGPTATGKTDLGIFLAQKYNGEIISADSRQVYTEMDIGTGKQYSDSVKIHGYDLVNPREEFSVGHFQKFAHQKIKEITDNKKLPILVGGTGLYIRSIVESITTAVVPPDHILRKNLEEKLVEELYADLVSLDPKKAHALNNSDRANPRRLIRAIEIAKAPELHEQSFPLYDTLFVGLKAEMPFLEQRLKTSIESRLSRGFVEEVKRLIAEGILPESKAMSATGYREITQFLEGSISEKEAIQLWFLSERQYVKRQLTWFEKVPDINWFDISDPLYKSRVEELVEKWDNNLCLAK